MSSLVPEGLIIQGDRFFFMKGNSYIRLVTVDREIFVFKNFRPWCSATKIKNTNFFNAEYLERYRLVNFRRWSKAMKINNPKIKQTKIVRDENFPIYGSYTKTNSY